MTFSENIQLIFECRRFQPPGRQSVAPGSTMAPGLAEKVRVAGYGLSCGLNVSLDEVVLGITAVSPLDGLRRQVLDLDCALPPGSRCASAPISA
jgi:hypothetical protein